jgi:antirestriction protein ArdC
MYEAKTTAKRIDVYEQITNHVIEALEKGQAIWRKPWKTHAGRVAAVPKNLTTQKAYQGWNTFSLCWAGLMYGFTSPYFLTFKQAQALGGHIKKGSHGTQIIKWVAKTTDTIALNPKSGHDEITGTDLRLYPKLFVVFNVEQTEGIEYPKPEPIRYTDAERLDVCEKIITGMPDKPGIREGGNRACYFPGVDGINIPPYQSFSSPEEYYSTLFHELIHSTGHPKRLNRKELIESDGFGKKEYSKEELTAEMGAAFLCGMCGIEQKTIDNSTAYIANWLSKLKNDKKMIVQAASKAQAAADYILNVKQLAAQPLVLAEAEEA